MAAARNLTAHDLVRGAADALDHRKDEVDRLNVFPVPDGDTGTNMALTMDAVMESMEAVPEEASIAEACHAVAHGSLMGARGNSGVILSQILRGVCDIIGEAPKVDADLVAGALEKAVTVAFQAVRKPVEGTMLTVLRDSADAARRAAEESHDLHFVLETIAQEAKESVLRTPDLLPVLAEAGVVDAGGLGLAVLVEGFVAALEGHDVRDFDVDVTPSFEVAAEPQDDWDDAEYLYCTEFLLTGSGLDRDTVHEWVAAAGGSELVVGDEDMLKIHVHTDDPAGVLARATASGEIAHVHINNMRAQTAERRRLLKDQAQKVSAKPIGIVAVASGAGLAEILTSLGVDAVVDGGQTANPSTAELLEAADAVAAERVIVLPNNRNVILAAQQVDSLSEKPVVVVPTTSVPQAFSALLAFEPDAALEENVAEMTDAAADVRVGEVTTAIKDSKGAKVGDITAGQVIGIIDHEIEVVGHDVGEVASRLLDRIAGGGETLTVLAGEDLTQEDLERLAEAMGEAHPELTIETHRGDQPLYPVILAVE